MTTNATLPPISEHATALLADTLGITVDQVREAEACARIDSLAREVAHIARRDSSATRMARHHAIRERLTARRTRKLAAGWSAR